MRLDALTQPWWPWGCLWPRKPRGQQAGGHYAEGSECRLRSPDAPRRSVPVDDLWQPWWGRHSEASPHNQLEGERHGEGAEASEARSSGETAAASTPRNSCIHRTLARGWVNSHRERPSSPEPTLIITRQRRELAGAGEGLLESAQQGSATADEPAGAAAGLVIAGAARKAALLQVRFQ